MCHEQCLQVHDFFAKLLILSVKRIILGCKDLDLGLQIGEPLLLSLTTLERGDTVSH
jgi:hypothetical protein